MLLKHCAILDKIFTSFEFMSSAFNKRLIAFSNKPWKNNDLISLYFYQGNLYLYHNSLYDDCILNIPYFNNLRFSFGGYLNSSVIIL